MPVTAASIAAKGGDGVQGGCLLYPPFFNRWIMSDDIKSLKEKLQRKKTEKKPVEGLSTGSTLLNLACTGTPNIGFTKGRYFFIVGDSSSGKSFLSMTCLAEASINKAFDNYRFISDDVEDGLLMDKLKYFGKGVCERIEPPAGTRDNPKFSSTVEEFYFHLDDALEQNKPFIYILDSMDGITTEDDVDKFKEKKKAYEKDKESSGSYGTSKAKANSRNMSQIIPRLRKSGSILIIISQTRDNIGFGSQFNPKTRSGGKALRFYATLEIWSSVREHIKKVVKGKQRDIGIVSQLRIKKNRQTGREPIIDVNILHSVGIDDIGSCVQYLIDEKHWKESNGRVNASEFTATGLRTEDLIGYIEESNQEKKLKSLVTEVWREIEAGCSVTRKNRYG